MIKVGISAAVARALGGSKEFKKLLFRHNRTVRQSVYLTLFTAFPFALGVYIRCSVKSFVAADLGFEASILIGIMGGRLAGIIGGVLLAFPALFYGEYPTLPGNVIVGVVAGSLRSFFPHEEKMWGVSPFLDLSVYTW